MDRGELDQLLRDHAGLEGLAREAGNGDPAAPQPWANDNGPIGWVLRQEAASVFFVAIAALLLAWFVWTLL